MSTRRSTRTILLLSLGLAALATASCSDDVYWEHWHHPDPDDGWRPVGTPGNPPCDGHHPGGPNGGGPNGGGPNGGGPGGPGGPPGPGGSGADAGLGADGGHAALDGGGLAGDAGAGREDGGALADAGGGGGGAGDAGPGCNSDTDCAPGEICTTGGVCVLPACGNLHTESACLGRHDCVPIYAGMNCRDQAGSQCVSGESGCICATYSFAVCVGRQ